jgi:hypothetical protein
MLPRLGQVLYWSTRWRYSIFVVVGVTAAILIAAGVPSLSAFKWGCIVGIAFTTLGIAVSDEKAKWEVVGVLLCFTFLLILVAMGIILKPATSP